jgi:hypothetical protein
MKKTKIYMGIPSMGDRWDYQTYMLREIAKRYEDEVELVYPELLCHRFGHDFARNEIVEEFLNSDCDILWFLDADVAPPNHILDLVTIYGKNNWLVAGAPYPLWLSMPNGEMGVTFSAYEGNAPDANGRKGLRYTQVTKQGTEWVDGLATGCLFIKRELFTKLEKPYFEFKRKHESQEVIEGEDLGLALKLQQLGIKYFCDHGMVCSHYKRVNLLEVNNYAVAFANAKLMEYDANVREAMQNAVNAAAKQGAIEGYKRGKADALKESGAIPQKTKSGLILPSSLTT